MKHHVAISVDVDRFPDGYLEKHYVNGIKINGERVTVERFRELCAELRAEGMEVFPPCDHVDEKGFCKGHPAPVTERQTRPRRGFCEVTRCDPC